MGSNLYTAHASERARFEPTKVVYRFISRPLGHYFRTSQETEKTEKTIARGRIDRGGGRDRGVLSRMMTARIR